LRQVSPESEPIYDFLVTLHTKFNGDWSKVQKESGLSDEDFKQFLNYAAQFLGNAGNYKSFGDVKFVPRFEPSQLKALAAITPETLKLYEKFQDRIFADETVEKMHLGYPPEHLSTYYPESPNITKDEVSAVSDFLEAKKLLPENTRIKKTQDGFEVLIASAQSNPSSADRDLPESEWTLEGSLAGKKLKLVFGDHAKEMETIVSAIEKAEQYAANDTQKQMLIKYAQTFRTGSLEAFLDSQRFWIRDKGPVVETDIGL
jgi:dipeptidyl-peptidase-3